jgi:hypothetical protein
MGLEINDVNDLQKLLASVNLKVQSIEELKGLLAVVQGPTDPETARLKTIKQIGYHVPAIMAAAAGCVSFFLCIFSAVPTGGLGPVALLGGLGVMWGAVALVSVPAVLSAMILLARLKIEPAAPRDRPPAAASGLGVEQRLSEFITARKDT